MKIKFGIYSAFLLLLVLVSSCISSKKVPYFQTQEDRKGKVVDLPSDRLKSVVRFKPDDVLGITVNVPESQSIAADYNLPLVPAATSENSTEDFVSQAVGRQAFMIGKDGTIDFPVVGTIKVAGYTQGELEIYLKELLGETITAQQVVTVRLQNFKITVLGEVGKPGEIKVEKDHINLAEALALAGDMTIYGKRDDVRVHRRMPNGDIRIISLDISNEDIISSPYYFLQQNDMIYVIPVKAKTQSADVSPMLSVAMGVTTFALSLVTFVLIFTK